MTVTRRQENEKAFFKTLNTFLQKYLLTLKLITADISCHKDGLSMLTQFFIAMMICNNITDILFYYTVITTPYLYLELNQILKKSWNSSFLDSSDWENGPQ